MTVASVSGELARPRTFSSSRITLRGTEEVRADHLLRARGRGGDQRRCRGVEVLVARIACGGGCLVEPREHLTLHLDVLEHRLDDDVGVPERGVVGDARDARERLRGALRRPGSRARPRPA